jgi:hypothetical protein
MASRKMKKTVNVEEGTLTIEIAGKAQVYAVADLKEAIVRRSVLHGIGQKLGDSCASVTPTFAVIDKVWKSISGPEGTWSARKPAAAKVDEAELIKVLTSMGKTPEEAQAVIDQVKAAKAVEK